MDELRALAGTTLDAELVDVFLSVLQVKPPFEVQLRLWREGDTPTRLRPSCCRRRERAPGPLRAGRVALGHLRHHGGNSPARY